MKRWLKISLATVGALAAVAATTLGWALHQADARMARHVRIASHPVTPGQDAASLSRGRYLFESRGCTDCHGTHGGGKLFIDDGAMKVAGPNITRGPGSVVVGYRPEDWERAIRHGVKPDGKPLMIMPSEDYNRLTDQDLAALVGYLRQLPPVAGQGAVLQLPPPVRALYGLGLIQDAAARIDHSLPPQEPVPEGVTVAHGRYVANMCMGCHGPLLAGGKIPGAPPDWPAAANLTSGDGSGMSPYTSATAFGTMMRTGRRPDGTQVSSVMPFGALKHLSDTDVGALYAYLRTLPPQAKGPR
ncbi:MAG TPA: cytochrome c [Candidatus Aquabacterium excrementipullorum]|nr:cytochrome c [Candidatus Aquabacterium excrementipullorum]